MKNLAVELTPNQPTVTPHVCQEKDINGTPCVANFSRKLSTMQRLVVAELRYINKPVQGTCSMIVLDVLRKKFVSS
jgi:hypothetical protein